MQHRPCFRERCLFGCRSITTQLARVRYNHKSTKLWRLQISTDYIPLKKFGGNSERKNISHVGLATMIHSTYPARASNLYMLYLKLYNVVPVTTYIKELRQMDLQMVMQELEALGKERLKKMYMSNGAHEPLFGVATGSMKPIAKKIKQDQALAEQLYSTGNYDAMYFAGVIADPKAMSAEDFERWMDSAYFYMISDYIVAVTLSETDIAQEIADRWIASGEDLRMSAGWSCYCWLLGSRKDHEFSESKLADMLEQVAQSIHTAPLRTKSAMNNFIYTVAISYVPLHEQAVATAKAVGPVEFKKDAGKAKYLDAAENIQKSLDRGQLGFKRKYVRC